MFYMHAFSYMIYVLRVHVCWCVCVAVCVCVCVCVLCAVDQGLRIVYRGSRIGYRSSRIKDRIPIPNFVHFGFPYRKPKWTKFGIETRSLILVSRFSILNTRFSILDSRSSTEHTHTHSDIDTHMQTQRVSCS